MARARERSFNQKRALHLQPNVNGLWFPRVGAPLRVPSATRKLRSRSSEGLHLNGGKNEGRPVISTVRQRWRKRSARSEESTRGSDRKEGSLMSNWSNMREANRSAGLNLPR